MAERSASWPEPAVWPAKIELIPRFSFAAANSMMLVSQLISTLEVGMRAKPIITCGLLAGALDAPRLGASRWAWASSPCNPASVNRCQQRSS